MKKILLFCALAIFLAGCRADLNKTVDVTLKVQPTDNEVIHSSFFMDRDFFERAYKDERQKEAKDTVVAGIIPHHLLASHLISRFFLGLSRATPSVVVLIGPNHFDVGNGPVLLSSGSWATPYGDLRPATETVTSLVKAGLGKIDERVFEQEHSISAEVAFIKKAFPQTLFVPIVLKNSVKADEAKSLVEKLAEMLPEDTLVLASVDFSHEVTPEEAEEQAEKNIAVLTGRDVSRVSEMNVDSKPTITVLLEYTKLRGVKRSVLLESSDAAKVTGEMLAEVTSYLTMYFVK